MKMRENVLIVVIIIMTPLLFCGCLGTEVGDNVYVDIFESDVANLINYSVELQENKYGIIIKAIVNGRIENIVDRTVDLVITADFYDKNDVFLGETSYTIIGLRNKPKPGSSTTFTIVYDEENVVYADHAKLRAIEKI